MWWPFYAVQMGHGRSCHRKVSEFIPECGQSGYSARSGGIRWCFVAGTYVKTYWLVERLILPNGVVAGSLAASKPADDLE